MQQVHKQVNCCVEQGLYCSEDRKWSHLLKSRKVYFAWIKRTFHSRSYGVQITSLSVKVFNITLAGDRHLLEGLPILLGNLGKRISKVS